MNKYKCIKEFNYSNKTIMEPGDIIIVNENDMIYNISKGVDHKNIKFEWIKECLNNISDDYKSLGKCSFEEITHKILNTHKKKNADYGNSFYKTLDFWGLQAAGIRMSDKLERFNNIVKNGSFKVKDESITDTLEDLATYAIMTVMYLQK